MIGLVGLWLVSLALSGVALLIVAGLIVARWIHGRAARRAAEERARLIPLLLGAERSFERFEPDDGAAGLLTDLTVQFIELVRGDEKDHLVSSATRLGVPITLRERLRSGTVRTRLAAAEVMVHFPGAACVATLNSALDDTSDDVRLTAAMALAAMGKSPPVAELLDKLGIGSRENSMLVLGLFKEIARTRPDEVEALIDSDVALPVKAAAIEALAATGDYKLVPTLADLATEAEHDSEELPRYLRALGKFAHPASAPAVRHCLASPVWIVRSAAAEAAGKIGLADASGQLVELLGDPSWWVRFRAGEALAKLGEKGVGLLRETAANGPEEARRTARLTLRERRL